MYLVDKTQKGLNLQQKMHNFVLKIEECWFWEKIENVFFFIRLKWMASVERSSLMGLVSEVTLSWISWS